MTNSDVLPSAERLGLPHEQVVFLPHAVDSKKLFATPRRMRPHTGARIHLRSSRRPATTGSSATRTRARRNDRVIRALAVARDQGLDCAPASYGGGATSQRQRRCSPSSGSATASNGSTRSANGSCGRGIWQATRCSTSSWPRRSAASTFEAMALGRRVITALDSRRRLRFSAPSLPSTPLGRSRRSPARFAGSCSTRRTTTDSARLHASGSVDITPRSASFNSRWTHTGACSRNRRLHPSLSGYLSDAAEPPEIWSTRSTGGALELEGAGGGGDLGGRLVSRSGDRVPDPAGSRASSHRGPGRRCRPGRASLQVDERGGVRLRGHAGTSRVAPRAVRLRVAPTPCARSSRLGAHARRRLRRRLRDVGVDDASDWADGSGEWVGADISAAIDVASSGSARIPGTHFVQADILPPPFRPAELRRDLRRGRPPPHALDRARVSAPSYRCSAGRRAHDLRLPPEGGRSASSPTTTSASSCSDSARRGLGGAAAADAARARRSPISRSRSRCRRTSRSSGSRGAARRPAARLLALRKALLERRPHLRGEQPHQLRLVRAAVRPPSDRGRGPRLVSTDAGLEVTHLDAQEAGYTCPRNEALGSRPHRSASERGEHPLVLLDRPRGRTHLGPCQRP